MKQNVLPLISTISSGNSAFYAVKHCKSTEDQRWRWKPKLGPNQALIWDRSWNAESKQPKLVVGWKKGKKKYIPAKLDINQANSHSVTSLDALEIPRYLLRRSEVTSVRIQRGHGDQNAMVFPVIGEIVLDLRHAKGRSCRMKSKIEEGDLKELQIKTLVVSKFPPSYGYDIIAGDDFLELNELYTDDNHGQLRNKKYKTFIQYVDPSKETYLEVHSSFWKKHYRVPRSKAVLPKTPKFCDQCFIKIEKEAKEPPKFSKRERVICHFALKDVKEKLSGQVTNYSNSHIVCVKLAGKKCQIAVPECTITKEGDSEKPIKYRTFPPSARKCLCIQWGFPNHSFSCQKLSKQPSIFHITSTHPPSKPPTNLSISPIVSISIPAVYSPAFSEIYSEFDVASNFDDNFEHVENWVSSTLKEEVEVLPMEDPVDGNPMLPIKTGRVKTNSVLMVQDHFSDDGVLCRNPVNLKRKTKTKLKPKIIKTVSEDFCSPNTCYCHTFNGRKLCRTRFPSSEEPLFCTPYSCFCHTSKGRRLCRTRFPSSEEQEFCTPTACYCETSKYKRLCRTRFPTLEPDCCSIDACFCGPGGKRLCRTRF